MQTHPARARRPVRPAAMLAQPGQLLPVRAAVGRLEQRRVFHAGIHGIGIRQRRLQVPHPLELPRMRRPVIPLMRSRHALIRKLVSHRSPRLSAVVRPLQNLSKPPARLRRIQAVRIHRRSLHVVHLPPRKKRPAHLPILPLAIGAQHKSPLLRPHQHSYTAHAMSPPGKLFSFVSRQFSPISARMTSIF